MPTESVFSPGDAFSWRLDGVEFKTIPGLIPLIPLVWGVGGGGLMKRKLNV